MKISRRRHVIVSALCTAIGAAGGIMLANQLLLEKAVNWELALIAAVAGGLFSAILNWIATPRKGLDL